MNFLKEKNLLLSGGLFISLMLFILLIWPSILFAQNESVIISNPPVQSRYTTTYGPVVDNEGLWGIAEKLRTDKNTSILQMALALFKLNPGAFGDHNMNGLLAGSVLKVPDNHEVLQLSRQEAFTLFQQHWQLWQNSNPQLPDTKLAIHVIETTQSDNDTERQKDTLKIVPDTSLQTSRSTHDYMQAASGPSDSSTFIDPSKKTSFLNYIEQFQWHSLEQLTQGFKDIVNLDYQQFDISAFSNWIQVRLLKSPILIILIGFGVFVFLVLFFRRQEKDLNLSASRLYDTSASERKPMTDSLEERPVKIDSFADEFNLHLPDHDGKAEKLARAMDIAHDQVNINKFLHPRPKESFRRGKSLLEAAFDKEIFSHGVGFIQDEVKDIGKEQSCFEEQKNEATLHGNLLDSVDEIKFVNDKTHESKVEAFWNITQSEKMMDDELFNDFSNFKDNDKIAVFIQEFEQIMANLSQQTPAIEKSPDDLENIVQFKLSIHFIKILSDIMQATYLKQFSNTVIEFLEDIIDGKISMSSDVTHRLLLVVSFYNRYIHSVKGMQS